MMRRFPEFLRDIIELGQRQGEFRADADVAGAVGVYAGAVLGAEIQYDQDPDGIDLERAMETFLDQCLAQLRNPQQT